VDHDDSDMSDGSGGGHASEEDATPLLRALGLTAREAAVLQVVATEGDTTAAAVAAVCGLSRPQVSQALQVLEDLALVERCRDQRPHAVLLAGEVQRSLRGLLQQLLARQAAERGRAERGAELLRARAAAVERRPRAYLRRLHGAGPGATWELLRPEHSYTEVTRPGGLSVLISAHLHPNTATRRLLVVGELAPQHRQRLEARGIRVRATAAVLPYLVVVDGVRAAVEVGTTRRGDIAWTFDRAQVDALARLFELWWSEAEPQVAPQRRGDAA
jgi:DNA-binding MarR family transcriptional regulator